MASGKPRISQNALAWLAGCALFLSSVVGAAERTLTRADLAGGGGEGRYALVIGNSDYSTSPLKNPANDAKDVSKKLRDLHFEVTSLMNTNKRDMVDAIRAFGKKLRPGGVGFFYYSGHGMQVNGNNYLVPIGADIKSEGDVEFEAFESGRLLSELAQAGNRLNLVVLDACRDNPFARSFRSSQIGLAHMDAPSGTLVAFSTSPGRTAADGEGRNGAYTKHLLAQMSTPGLPVEQMFKRVRQGVMKDTGSVQVPWESSSLVGDFYFAGGSSVVAPVTPPASESPPPTAIVATAQGNARQSGQRYRDRLKDGSEGPELVVIPAGTFDMGSLPSEVGREDAEGPVHRVTLNKPFALGKYEVTVGEFRKFASATNYQTDAERDYASVKGCSIWLAGEGNWDWRAGTNWQSPGYEQKDAHPVVCVSHNDVEKYLVWLNEQTGKRYRLPSEAEWEYAARAGSTTARYWGDNPSEACRYANVANEGHNWRGAFECRDGYEFTAPVGSYLENAFGLKDMLGNVWEWTADCWNEDYRGAPTDGSAWKGGECGRRVVRGGSWTTGPARGRSAYRDRYVPATRNFNLGFRLAQDI